MDIHHHHMTGSQLRKHNMVQIGQKNIGIGGLLDGYGGDHAAAAHRAQNGQDFPVILWSYLGARASNAYWPPNDILLSIPSTLPTRLKIFSGK